MYAVLTVLALAHVVCGSGSYVCGPGGNMSDVTEWTRISDLFKDNLDLENPFDYKAVLDTYRKVGYPLLVQFLNRTCRSSKTQQNGFGPS